MYIYFIIYIYIYTHIEWIRSNKVRRHDRGIQSSSLISRDVTTSYPVRSMRNIFCKLLRAITYACNIGNVVNHKNEACKHICHTAIEGIIVSYRIVSHGPAKANCSLRLSIVTVFLSVMCMCTRHRVLEAN